MPEIQGIETSEGSRFLKLTEASIEDTMIIKSPHRDTEGKFGMQTIVDVTYKGDNYSLALNKTSISRLITDCGSNSDNWVDVTVKMSEAHSTKFNKTYKIVTPIFTE